MILHTIRVDIPRHGYPIYLGEQMLEGLGEKCREHHVPDRVVLLADRNSARAALKGAIGSLRSSGYKVSPVIIPAGEQQKSINRAAAVHGAMLKAKIPRSAALIALGGGVVGDVGGFVASTYRRGLVFIQCPTTLLSQVDSSVGGKNGVNLPLSKNAIGTFHQPLFVYSDVELIRTLPKREIIAGLGEILKYPLVADPGLLAYIEDHLDELLAAEKSSILEVATRCLSIKAKLVSEDEKELLPDRGRVLLNVGHSVGHALETLSHYKLRHGEAVLLGILAEGYVATQIMGFPRSALDRFVVLYKRMNRRYNIRDISKSAILRKLPCSGSTRYVLPRSPGDVAVVHSVPEQLLLDSLRFLAAL